MGDFLDNVVQELKNSVWLVFFVGSLIIGGVISGVVILLLTVGVWW